MIPIEDLTDVTLAIEDTDEDDEDDDDDEDDEEDGTLVLLLLLGCLLEEAPHDAGGD